MIPAGTVEAVIVFLVGAWYFRIEEMEPFKAAKHVLGLTVLCLFIGVVITRLFNG